MKKLIINLFLLMIVFTYSSCKKETFVNSISISDLYSYTDVNNTPCDGKLKHQGEIIKIHGYISKHNTFPNENRFHVYETSMEKGPRIVILVVKNSNKIFNEISKHIPNLSNPSIEEEYVKTSIRGKIIGKSLPANGCCTMGVFLEINNACDIRFE